MATNDKHQEIVKRIFGANNGLQMKLLRQKIEIMEFLQSGVTPNSSQQKYIDEVNETYKSFNNRINSYLGVKSIEDIKDENE